MKDKDYYKKIRYFRRRLNVEAGIRAGAIGLGAGLAGAVAVLLYGRLCYQKLLLTEAGLAAAVLFLLTVVLGYFLWLRPRKKEVLRRIDALGLQERIITMEELWQEETVMARKQRQDAKERLAELDADSMKSRLYIRPLFWCLGLGVTVLLLVLLPLPEKEVDEQAEKNALEMMLVDEMITALREAVDNSEVADTHKSELHEIVDALAVSFLPEDSTLTRTAKIATSSKRLDLLVSAEQSELTLKKQQSDGSEAVETEIENAEAEQKLLTNTVKEMQDIMGTSINVLNNTEGNFWTPIGPSASSSFEEEPSSEEEESVLEEDTLEGLEPLEGGLTPNAGEQQEGEITTENGGGEETIYDPEYGEIGYGSVYEEYYQEILKSLTERELSEEMREIIEDYANSLE